jgi:large subunit ribosomal protein L25
MEFATIVVQPRTVIGKKVKALRRTGVLPGNVYGKGLESKAVQMDGREFVRVARSTGVRSMFKLAIEGESQPRYVFIKGLMREGGMGAPRHVDFYQVELTKPVDASVPLVFTGESPAVRDLAGTLTQHVGFVTIRTLPLELPEHIEIDLGAITSFDITLTAADIQLPEGITLVDVPETMLARVNPPRLFIDDEEDGGTGDAPEADAD